MVTSCPRSGHAARTRTAHRAPAPAQALERHRFGCDPRVNGLVPGTDLPLDQASSVFIQPKHTDPTLQRYTGSPSTRKHTETLRGWTPGGHLVQRYSTLK